MKPEPDPAAPLRLAPATPPAQPEPARPSDPGSPYPKCELFPRLLARLFDLMVCGALIALMHRAGAAAGSIYLLFADGLFRGQSLGKKVVGIRVVHVPSRRGAGARQSAIRNFPMALLGLVAMAPPAQWLVPAAFALALLGSQSLEIVVSPLGLRGGDALARTQVVDAKVVAGAPALAGAGMGAQQNLDRMPRRVARIVKITE